MKKKSGGRASVRHAEVLEEQLSDLIEAARVRGLSLREDELDPASASVRDLTDTFREQLQKALEDEVIPAAKVGARTAIEHTELDHELIKKALVGLKLPALRDLAREKGIDAAGGSEPLATRIGRHYRWDEEQIARLVLEHEDEPRPERGRVDRMFPLIGRGSTEKIRERLQYVLGRYIRVGIAKWFVFDDIQVRAAALSIVGTLRSYQAHVDESAASPTLTAVGVERRMVAQLAEGENLLHVAATSSTDARTFTQALAVGSGLELRGAVPLPAPLPGDAASFDLSSLFMLDLLINRLPRTGVREPNLTVARFRIGEERAFDENDESSRPSLHAVRFEGRHLLDSVAACELLAKESRALVDISLRVTSRSASRDVLTRYPVRIALERDHVVLMTGFGASLPEDSAHLHRSFAIAVSNEIRDGILVPHEVEALCRRIRTRAAGEVPEVADILAPQGLSGTGPSDQ